ncbi:MAG TPA: hypothetical protein VEA36_02065 [Candidatus Paceibacterota bacterium]|nr:hypothetical protein [Candidatus Paceibacterota bacterium]
MKSLMTVSAIVAAIVVGLASHAMLGDVPYLMKVPHVVPAGVLAALIALLLLHISRAELVPIAAFTIGLFFVGLIFGTIGASYGPQMLVIGSVCWLVALAGCVPLAFTWFVQIVVGHSLAESAK